MDHFSDDRARLGRVLEENIWHILAHATVGATSWGGGRPPPTGVNRNQSEVTCGQPRSAQWSPMVVTIHHTSNPNTHPHTHTR